MTVNILGSLQCDDWISPPLHVSVFEQINVLLFFRCAPLSGAPPDFVAGRCCCADDIFLRDALLEMHSPFLSLLKTLLLCGCTFLISNCSCSPT